MFDELLIPVKDIYFYSLSAHEQFSYANLDNDFWVSGNKNHWKIYPQYNKIPHKQIQKYYNNTFNSFNEAKKAAFKAFEKSEGPMIRTTPAIYRCKPSNYSGVGLLLFGASGEWKIASWQDMVIHIPQATSVFSGAYQTRSTILHILHDFVKQNLYQLHTAPYIPDSEFDLKKSFHYDEENKEQIFIYDYLANRVYYDYRDWWKIFIKPGVDLKTIF